MNEEDYIRRIDLAEKAIIRKYKLDDVEKVASYKATLSMSLSAQGGSRCVTTALPLALRADKALEEVLEVLVKMLVTKYTEKTADQIIKEELTRNDY